MKDGCDHSYSLRPLGERRLWIQRLSCNPCLQGRHRPIGKVVPLCHWFITSYCQNIGMILNGSHQNPFVSRIHVYLYMHRILLKMISIHMVFVDFNGFPSKLRIFWSNCLFSVVIFLELMNLLNFLFPIFYFPAFLNLMP